MSSLRQSKFSEGRWATVPPVAAIPHPADLDRLPSKRPPLRKRASRTLTRFLITFCIGVAATLIWQSFGDAARETIASSSARLAWLAPQAAPVAQTAPAAPSSDQAEIKAISFGLAGVRQRVDQIAAQLAAGQEQMTRDIANKLQATEQDILDKILAPQTQPAAAPARRPGPMTAPSQTPQLR